MDYTNQENIKKILEDRKIEDLPSVQPRNYSNFSLKSMNFILAITGPRRAGKTFFMFQLIKELIENRICEKEDILFLNFEHPRLSKLNNEDMLDIISIYQNIYGKSPEYLFFDEIQNIEGWGKVMRYFHDKGFKIVVSGSSSKLLLNEIGTELRGRYIHKLILPFSFDEFCTYNNFDIEKYRGSSHEGLILNQFDRYYEHGGFPLVIKEENAYIKEEILKELYNTIYYRDLLERYRINDQSGFELLMNYSLDMYGGILAPSKFVNYCKEVGIKLSKPTVLNYLKYLEESFFLIGFSKFGWTPKAQLLNPQKVYLIDNGFIRLANNYSENRGKKLENLVAIQLYKQEYDVFYFSEKNECDFVIKKSTQLKIENAIQVTWELNPSTQDREIKGLLEAMNKFSLSEGLILTYNQKTKIEKDGKIINVLPIWEWLIDK